VKTGAHINVMNAVEVAASRAGSKQTSSCCEPDKPDRCSGGK